jgi:hypothetical protein
LDICCSSICMDCTTKKPTGKSLESGSGLSASEIRLPSDELIHVSEMQPIPNSKFEIIPTLTNIKHINVPMFERSPSTTPAREPPRAAGRHAPQTPQENRASEMQSPSVSAPRVGRSMGDHHPKTEVGVP